MHEQARLISFIGAASADETRRFYTEILDLRLVSDEPDVLVFDSNGAMLRVNIVDDYKPPPFTALGWEVPDIGQILEALSGRGLAVERFSGMKQDQRGVATFPDGTQVCWFKDPAGNMLSLTEFAQV